MIIIGIDPGQEKSGMVVFNVETGIPDISCVLPNDEIRAHLSSGGEYMLAQEMPANYGMGVGAPLLETCVHIGRFIECAKPNPHHELYRKTIATCVCGLAKAKGPQIRASIIDMYGAGGIGGKKCKKCKGKGWFGAGRRTCTECTGTGWNEPPGPLYHVSTHAWDALAVALTYAIKAGYLSPLAVNPEGLGKNFQHSAHDASLSSQTACSIPLDEPF